MDEKKRFAFTLGGRVLRSPRSPDLPQNERAEGVIESNNEVGRNEKRRRR